MPKQTTLKRTLNLPLLILYGLGTIIGAGIYVLVGEVISVAGIYAPLSFLLAALLASLSAFSFAEFASRFPKSAGEAIYIKEGLTPHVLPVIAGLMVASVGIISSAVIAHGFVGYLQTLIDVPDNLITILLIITLGLVAIWGIAESVTIAAIITAIEIGGLLLVVVISATSLSFEWPSTTEVFIPDQGIAIWMGVLSGAFLAFYAFTGFEDMVNVAEEVKDVRRALPQAIIIALLFTTALYSAITFVAVSVISPDELSHADALLTDIYAAATGRSPVLVSVIGLFAVVNGALVQIIMASRVLYGLRNEWRVFRPFRYINPLTRTPWVATVVTTLVTLFLALTFELVGMAKATAAITLSVFVLVNLALLRVKYKDPRPAGVFLVPAWIPSLGAAASLFFLISEFIVF